VIMCSLRMTTFISSKDPKVPVQGTIFCLTYPPGPFLSFLNLLFLLSFVGLFLLLSSALSVLRVYVICGISESALRAHELMSTGAEHR